MTTSNVRKQTKSSVVEASIATTAATIVITAAFVTTCFVSNIFAQTPEQFSAKTPAQISTQQIHPLNVTNTRPIVLVHGIPASRSAEIVRESGWGIDVNYEISNDFTNNSNGGEKVGFDGETSRLALSLKYGIYEGAEIEVVIPYIKHDGGFLDNFIDKWHKFFGFPDNGRDNVARDQLHFLYQKDGVTKLDFNEPAQGVGDAQIIFAFDVNKQWLTQQKNLVFKTSVKLPTGDSDKLTGSGGVAISAWFSGDRYSRWFGKDGLSYFSLGGMWLEKADIISDQQQSFVVFGGMGAGAKIGNRVVLQVQLDSHTPLYKDSNLTELDTVSFLLTLGGAVNLGADWNLDIAVTEDILPHTAPDVTFHLGINRRW